MDSLYFKLAKGLTYGECLRKKESTVYIINDFIGHLISCRYHSSYECLKSVRVGKKVSHKYISQKNVVFGIRASFKDLSMIFPSSIFIGNNFCHLPIASSLLTNENSCR